MSGDPNKKKAIVAGKNNRMRGRALFRKEGETSRRRSSPAAPPPSPEPQQRESQRSEVVPIDDLTQGGGRTSVKQRSPSRPPPPNIAENVREALEKLFYDRALGYTKDARLLRSRLPASVRSAVTLEQVKAFISNQEAVQLTRKPRTNRNSYKHISAYRPGQRLFADLIDMGAVSKKNFKNKWILSIIDVYSRFGWGVPMKDKKAETVVRKLESFLDTLQRESGGDIRVDIFASDSGSEFRNDLVKKLLRTKDIMQQFTVTGDHNAAGLIERFNSTLRSKLQLVWSAEGVSDWADILPDILANYNASEHSTTNAKPVDVLEGVVLPHDVSLRTEDGRGVAVSGTGIQNTDTEQPDPVSPAPVAEKSGKNKKARGRGVPPDKSLPTATPATTATRRARVLDVGDKVRKLLPLPTIFSKRAHTERYSRKVYKVSSLVDLTSVRIEPVNGDGEEELVRRNKLLLIGDDVGTKKQEKQEGGRERVTVKEVRDEVRRGKRVQAELKKLEQGGGTKSGKRAKKANPKYE